ncbi:hypothetical protein [Paenibacillus sp. KS-LC4]|uniref:hypothetical protein n=1 Tax=Paenibacillus sp. KS-LC4 TaxID=2979727 RepID=UPI0030D458CC
MRGLFADINFNRKEKIFFVSIFGFSLMQLVYFIMQNSTVNYYDEVRYIEISTNILHNGLFNIADNLRTYLYPLLMSCFFIFTDGDFTKWKIIFSLFQYIIYILTIFLMAKTAYQYNKTKLVYFSVLFLGLMNPYLIQATTLFLTDIIATCVVTVSLIYLLTSDLNKWKNGVIVSILLYCSVLIRPSSAIFMAIFLIIGAYRLIKIKDFKPVKFVIVGLFCLLLFFPQLYMNIKQFNHFTPLIHLNLFEQQSVWATQYLKYGTVTIGGEQPSLYFLSPWYEETAMSIFQLAWNNFFEFLFIFCAHIFGMLDWGYIDTYIKDLDVTSKITPAILLFINWFFIGVGVVALKKQRKHDFGTISLIFAAFGYTLFMATTAIESRFGYPIYLILLIFAGLGIQNIFENIRRKKFVIIISASLLVSVCASLFISYLIDSQTNRIFWVF